MKQSDWIVLLIIVIVTLSICLISIGNQECETSEGVSEELFIKMCNLYNTEAILVNEMIEYIDDYANPTGLEFTRQIQLDCYSLIN